MLLLDPQAEDSTRAKIVSDAVTAIESGGELVNQAEWGERPLAYPIDRKASADYHLLQFHAGDVALLEGLDRTLHLTDAVMRHRIIKLAPGTPPPNVPARPAEAGEQPAAAAPAAPAAAPAEAADEQPPASAS
jgi:small subunit ribosomal protein S6